MAFKLLLTEAQSALGKAVYHGLEEQSFTVVCPPADNFDWHNAPALSHYLDEHHPGLLINTLAYNDADAARSLALAEACRERQILCLHISSYRVFGTAGCEDHGVDETVQPEPDDDVGLGLLAAEEAFRNLDSSLVLRLPWIMDPAGDNIFTRVVSHLLSGDLLEVSDVCRGCPTTLDDVQRVITAIVLQLFCGAKNWGVFHLHTSDSCSEAEFADSLARLLEKEGQAVSDIDVRRNRECRLIQGCGLLKGARCMNNFGIQMRSWRQDLKPLVREWLGKKL